MTLKAHVKRFENEAVINCSDEVVNESPVALSFNGINHAVMMATPSDLDEFARGFSLSEGIVETITDIRGIDSCSSDQGVEVNIEISPCRITMLRERRRQLAGRSGCGLCGVEALEHAIAPVDRVRALSLSSFAIQQSLEQLPLFQPLRSKTGASHAAAFCTPTGEILFAFEDVGRHNALDKMLGHWALEPEPGFALVSSRASYEMVFKVCRLGLGALVAVSAPTSMAVDLAQQAGLNLIGFARQGRYQQYLSVG